MNFLMKSGMGTGGNYPSKCQYKLSSMRKKTNLNEKNFFGIEICIKPLIFILSVSYDDLRRNYDIQKGFHSICSETLKRAENIRLYQ